MTLGGFATGLLVLSHDGRPTKIEGNPDHPTSLGATSVFHQASLLDLYDPDRSQAVLLNSRITSWESFLGSIHPAVQSQHARRGAGLRILTETVTSPTLHAQLQTLLQRFPEAHWHQFEPLNRDNLRAGAELAFGQVLEPAYHFDKAQVILSLDSDFLYAHPAALRHTRQFIDQRRISSSRNEMNRLYAVESSPSVTGSNADHRLPLPSRDVEPFTRALIALFGIAADAAPDPRLQPHLAWIAAVADDLRLHLGTSIIIAGDRQPPIVHAFAHLLNQQLNNVGRTVTYSASAEAFPVQQNASLRHLVNALNDGSVDLLLILGGNPVFNAPVDLEFAQYLAKARLSLHLSHEVNETSACCQWHVPQSHYLESWSDARSVDGTVSLVQPLILPLHGGRSPHEVLDALLQQPTRSDYNIVRAHWNSQSGWADFEKRWRRALHDGLIAGTAAPLITPSLREFDLTSRTDSVHPGLEINFAPDPTLWDGRFANNGWLQELAKPLTKITWDNAALISPATARERDLSNGTIVQIEFHRHRFHGPVWITPGQADDTVTLHLGGGRSRVGRVGRGAGFNTYSIRASDAFWFAQGASLTATNARHPLAVTQLHHRIDSEERQILREGSLDQFRANPAFIQESTKTPDSDQTLYNPHEHRSPGYQWGMSIDLGACIGCSACVLACQAENNIPIVGKAQVAKGREMQWIRVDTYFSGSPDQPDVIHQPVPCMHCEHAPCELVCPVAATVHDQEGLNVQVYNRCIGTRYCSNNCPYKVRRFNFLSYVDPTPVLKLLRNPNVTVRSRGVMEKCTYCVQRISAARIEAKKHNRPIRDGELQTACQQVCPAEAISFGDVSNPDSHVSTLKASPLNFSMLGELNTRPRTTYLARLRNLNPALKHHPPNEASAPVPPRSSPVSPRNPGSSSFPTSNA
jgi:molybdopterin-containing oxidoreductase family iron-sulfur binding subunit